MFTLVVEFVVVTHVYYSCSMLVMGFQTLVGLIILDLLAFNIILFMTWLSLYHVLLKCSEKIVTLVMSGIDKLERGVVYKAKLVKIIAFV